MFCTSEEQCEIVKLQDKIMREMVADIQNAGYMAGDKFEKVVQYYKERATFGDRFCTSKEQETCDVEKRGCEGCFYNNPKNNVKREGNINGEEQND